MVFRIFTSYQKFGKKWDATYYCAVAGTILYGISDKWHQSKYKTAWKMESLLAFEPWLAKLSLNFFE